MAGSEHTYRRSASSSIIPTQHRDGQRRRTRYFSLLSFIHPATCLVSGRPCPYFYSVHKLEITIYYTFAIHFETIYGRRIQLSHYPSTFTPSLRSLFVIFRNGFALDDNCALRLIAILCAAMWSSLRCQRCLRAPGCPHKRCLRLQYLLL